MRTGQDAADTRAVGGDALATREGCAWAAGWGGGGGGCGGRGGESEEAEDELHFDCGGGGVIGGMEFGVGSVWLMMFGVKLD